MSRLLMKNLMHSFHKKSLKIHPKIQLSKMNQPKTTYLLNRLNLTNLNTNRNSKKKRMRMKMKTVKFHYSSLMSILEKDNQIESYFMMETNLLNLQTILPSSIN